MKNSNIDRNTIKERLLKSAKLIECADAIAIFAGAGMSVDSGLETYRGPDGLWAKTIKLNNKSVNYYDLSTPNAFEKEHELAWGFIGFLIEKYNKANPHVGYDILKNLVAKKEYFITTSNVDGHFQKAGFDKNKIFEFHGSIYYTQCGSNIECGIWPTPYIELDETGVRALTFDPSCPTCNSFCRPNMFLFDDDLFAPERTAEQQYREMEWRDNVRTSCSNIIAIEIGAGKTIPTIRRYAERFASDTITLIRVNIFDSETEADNHISVPLGAKDFFVKIDEIIRQEDCSF